MDCDQGEFMAGASVLNCDEGQDEYVMDLKVTGSCILLLNHCGWKWTEVQKSSTTST
jgi:hypothetical protein